MYKYLTPKIKLVIIYCYIFQHISYAQKTISNALKVFV